MKIETTLASQLYGTASRITEGSAAPAATEGQSFSEALEAAARDMLATVQQGERTAQAALVGQADAQSVVEALAATEMALQTAVTVRDRVVEAYQELLRMPV